jgi:carbamoyltransferase
MNTLGVSCYHHDSAAAYIKDGKIIGASHEERFSRKKYDNSFPKNTVSWLKNAHNDFDHAVFYEESTYKQFKSDIKKYTRATPVLVDHHRAHAMSSILTTDWDKCAVMVVDTIGGKFSTSLGVYENGEITWLKQFRYPNSLGLFYSTATKFLGLTPLADESQVMAAAAYGKPKWADYIKERVVNTELGDYTVLPDLTRGIGSGVLDWDIAASVQSVLEECLINLAKWLFKETCLPNLAYAGGVALNCVANTKLLTHTPFYDIAIQPAAGDAGCALGAAALLDRPLWENAYLGVNADNNVTTEECAFRLLKGEVVAIVKGKAEFGPRALGNRSFLTIPFTDNYAKLDKLKQRTTDNWRPYAPVCLEKDADLYFDIPKKSYEMLHIAKSKNKHFTTSDESARLQITNYTKNAYLSRVLELTREQGYPILINTSLNAKGKPIVNTMDDLKEIRLHN